MIRVHRGAVTQSRRFISATLLVVVFLLTGWATGPAQASEALALINVAGEQRMLSQRVAKSFIQLGLNVQTMATKSQLDEAIRRFETNQKTLASALTPYPDAEQAAELLSRAWAQMRPLAAGTPTLVGAKQLSLYAETTLNAAEMLVNLLADAAQVDEHQVLRLAARQRMLSQRIAKNYMLRSWGDDSAAVRHELEDAVASFDGVLTSLAARPGDSDAVRRELDELALQWEWLRAALDSEGALTYRLVISESADAILGSADRLTQLYQRQLAAR